MSIAKLHVQNIQDVLELRVKHGFGCNTVLLLIVLWYLSVYVGQCFEINTNNLDLQILFESIIIQNNLV